MEELNKLAADQQELGQVIQKLYTNLKKDLASRKTEEYFINRLANLQQHWEDFTNNHSKMIALQMPKHNYFESKYYEPVEKIYAEVKTYLIEGLQKKLAAVSQKPINPQKRGIEQDPAEKLESNPGQDAAQQLRLRKQEVKIQEITILLHEATTALIQEKSESRYKRLQNDIKKQWEDIASLHEEIKVYETSYTVVYFSSNQYSLLRQETDNIKEQLDEKIQKFSEATSPAKQYNIALPPIKIPIFEGDYENWTSFHDIFLKVIHSNPNMSAVEKMQYLKTHIRGEPSKLIQHLQIAEVNYETAWSILKSRYHNTRLLLSKLLKKIFNLPTMLQESADQIKQLHDTVTECLQAINHIGIDTSPWGPIISHIITSKWDAETNKLYEQSLRSPQDIQEFETVMDFLKTRFQSLEIISEIKKKEEKQYNPLNQQRWHQPTCKLCKFQHQLSRCSIFGALPVSERLRVVKENRLCNNCMNHSYYEPCPSSKCCQTCRKPHHTLLHRSQNPQPRKTFSTSRTTSHVTTATEQSRKQESQVAATCHIGRQNSTTLLATALVQARTSTGTVQFLRVLIDPGSQALFITEDAAQTLALPRQKIRAEVTDLGDGVPKVSNWKMAVTLYPRYPSNFNLQTEPIILSKLTKNLPTNQLDNLDNHPWQNHLLADPTFNVPGPIDIILGTEEYGKIIMEGLHKTKTGLLGQTTKFGWILSGRVITAKTQEIKITSMMTRIEEDKQLTKFWEIEEVPQGRQLTIEEKQSEEHYEKTHHRNNDGTYTVRIPFKETPTNLGESKPKAIARLLQLEKKFSNNKELEKQYKNFMQEYLDLKHMRKTTLDEQTEEDAYYVPHQAVIRASSTTTKLRVVFDASCKTSNGISINEKMYTGPRLQQELFDILIRWRKHPIAFTADIEKMYRQIQVDKEDQKFQKIVWRFNRNQPIQEYKLTTVTYGTASAPYLAIKTLQQLAKDEESNFPGASEAVLKDFYVDDLMSGAETLAEAYQLQNEIIKLLKSGGFTLRKWSSNEPKLLKLLPKQLQEQPAIEISEDTTKKTLGVHWNPSSDTFRFKVEMSNSNKFSKRTILSDIAKLYDPLGWLAPITIKVKMMIQELWKIELSWDEEVPEKLKNEWIAFRDQLNIVEELTIPRWLSYRRKEAKIELHGFCDASEKAYGAVIYSKITYPSGKATTTLLVAKSKVAPIKMKKTLPRLELCAALLLAKLLKRTVSALEVQDVPVYAWTDSMITLAWIKGDSGRWKTFVANRVAEIQELLQSTAWSHVKTEDNPADVLSRGIDPANLKNHQQWWFGPRWLQEISQKQRRIEEIPSTEEEAKLCYQITVVKQENDLIERFSSLTRMVRVVSYCRRFIGRYNNKNSFTGMISVQEYEDTLKQLIKMVQQSEFKNDIQSILRCNKVPKRSNISTLRPFIDNDGILRVGGRLENSQLPFNEKHPIILPNGNRISKLIIQDAHSTTLHGGNQTTLAYTRRKFWIINGKRAVNSIINKCVKCIRYKAQAAQQIMGDLPAARATQSHPFTHTGVDYAGPMQIRTTKGRGNKASKGYIALFVCLSIKAIHLEVVSDMSSEAFLAAFRRFTARRGRCAHMYSDNGTTFVGANKELQKEVLATQNESKTQESLPSKGTQWHFIPPAAPHFGGLWEAGVKSMKYHLKRIIGESTLTFEELSTLVYQIEACLNSRPLCPISNDINDFEVITPGHFLIGQALVTPPEPINTTPDINPLKRWRMIQKMKKDFWKIWSSEYLSRLQQRYKWKSSEENVNIGDLVLIKEKNFNPNKWPLARVIQVHPARDGTTRVVSLQHAGGATQKRPITKIIPLKKHEQGLQNDVPTQSTISTNSAVVQHNTFSSPPEQPKRKSKMKCVSTMGGMFMVLLISSIMAPVAQANYTIKYPGPGLYVEHIGSTQIERGHFRIELRFNKSRITEDEATVQKTVNHMETFCDKAKELAEHIQCASLVHHLQEEYKQFVWTIKSINGIVSPRQRRGVLGTLLTSVFGINDEVYKDIDALDKNQHKLIKASNHQTKFMLSALATFNETEAKVVRQLNRFQEKLNEGLQTINEMNKWYKAIDENKLNVHILHAYQIAANYIEEIQQFYNNLLNVHFKRGHLYELISPAHVSNIISTASKKLPSSISILEASVINTNVEHSRDSIHIFGYFHMAELEEFTVLKIIPIPMKVENGNYWTLEVPNGILAIDYNSQTIGKP